MTFCPYCDADIEEELNQDFIDSPNNVKTSAYSFECPKCGKNIEVIANPFINFTVSKTKDNNNDQHESQNI